MLMMSSSSCVAHATTSQSSSVAFVARSPSTRHALLQQHCRCQQRLQPPPQQQPHHLTMLSVVTTPKINGIPSTTESKTTKKITKQRTTTTTGSKVKGSKKVTWKEAELRLNDEDTSTKPESKKTASKANNKKEKKEEKKKGKSTNKKKDDDGYTNDDKTYYWVNDSDIFLYDFAHDNDNEEATRATTTTSSSNTDKNRSRITSKLHFKVRGNPRPLRRHRNGRGFMYNPSAPAQESFQECVKQLVYGDDHPSLPLPLFTSDICLSVSIVFKLKRPLKDFINNKRVEGRLKESAPPAISSTIRQDVDNLAKFVLDSCNNLLYEDDKQIISLSTVKLLDDDNLCEGSTEIILRPVLANNNNNNINGDTIDHINGVEIPML